jgi:hypothetical protein
VSDVVRVHGPVVETAATMIYQVTLASGVIVTDPAGFAHRDAEPTSDVPVFTVDGEPLLHRP